MRVLVTGALGQVGADVARLLQGQADVAARSRADLDLEKPDDIRRNVREARPDVIVNAAAYTAVDRAESEEDRARAVNGVAPGILAEEAKRSGALLIHYSTDYVFDGETQRPYVEIDATNPLSAYGRTKLEGEHAVAAAGGRHLILRTSWIYAPRGRNFMLTMSEPAVEPRRTARRGRPARAPTSSLQVARATLELLEAQREHPACTATARGDHVVRFRRRDLRRAQAKAGRGLPHAKLIPIRTADLRRPPAPEELGALQRQARERLRCAWATGAKGWKKRSPP
jgi:dTDP-4-dehydrorhamnose reductase